MRKIIPCFLLCLFLACAAAQAAEITVSAAASLTNAFTEIKNAFEKANPGIAVHLNFAASVPLLKQLLEGAPVDVFASADQPTMDKAGTAGVIDAASRKNFAANDLVMIRPKGASQPERLEDLQKCARIAAGDPDSVPAGRYAKRALTYAALWDKLAPLLIPAANVRQVLDYVARGEADAGFVYATDALQQADKVEAVLPVPGHEPVTYPIAVATTGSNAAAGAKFLDFVLSPQGQAILAKYGFARP